MKRFPTLLSLALVTAACGDDTSGDTGADTDNGTTDASSGDAAGPTSAAETNGDDDGSTGETGVLPTTAAIRVVHASPDAPAVDIYVAGVDTPVITGLAYGDASTYLDVEPGDYNFQVRAAGSDISSDPVYETGNLTLEAGARITALAAGLLTGQNEDDAFRVLALAEGFDSPTADEARVRIVHASADAPTVDLDVGDDGSAELEGVARFAESGEAGVALPSDTALQIGVLAGGDRVTAFTTPALPDGGELFVIATGLLASHPNADDGFALLAVGPEGAIGLVRQNPVVYAVHASPDAGNVDICAGGAALLSDVPFGAMAPIQVPPGSYTLDFAAPETSCATVAASQDTPELMAGMRYLAVATGEVTPEDSDPAFALAAFAEVTAGDEDVTLQIVHAASAPSVDVGVVAMGELDTLLAEDLAWPEAAALTEVPGASYPIGVAATGNTNPLATFTLDLSDGFTGFALAAGDLDGDDDEGTGFQLFIVDTAAAPWTLTAVSPDAP